MWGRGCVQGSAQNFARGLMEMPSNLMTPSLFVEAVQGRAESVRSSMADSVSLQVIPRYACCVCVVAHLVHTQCHLHTHRGRDRVSERVERGREEREGGRRERE